MDKEVLVMDKGVWVNGETYWDYSEKVKYLEKQNRQLKRAVKRLLKNMKESNSPTLELWDKHQRTIKYAEKVLKDGD